MPIPLVERSESYIAHRVRRRVKSFKEVADCAEVSIGYTRKKPSIHLDVTLKRNPTYEETHRVCSTIEDEVRHIVPNSHVDINSQPSGMDGARSVWKIVKELTETESGSRGTQNIHLSEVGEGLGVDFLFVTSARATGRHVGRIEAQLEEKLKTVEPRVKEVVVHCEMLPELVSNERSGSGTEARWLVEHVARRFPELKLLRPPAIQKLGDQTSVGVRVAFIGSGKAKSAMDSISNLEGAIRAAYPAITRIDVLESGVRQSFVAGARVSGPV